MREIINLQIGLCGNRIGSKFWEQIAEEHSLFPDGTLQHPISRCLNYIDTYFSCNKDCQFKARSVNMDTEPGTLDQVKCSFFGNLFKRENFLAGVSGSSNNWATGHYSRGCEMLDCCLDCIRREAEAGDSIQGFQMIHSLGGGTGSGFGALLLEHLDDLYSKKIKMTLSVIPSTKVLNNVVEPYNSCLSLKYLSTLVDECVIVDNEALFDICYNVQNITHPIHQDLNHLICCALTAVTAGFRFNAQPNIDLRKLSMNLIPFPHLNFYVPAYAPLFQKDTVVVRESVNINDLITGVLSGNLMAACNPLQGKFLTAATVFRGRLPLNEVDAGMACFQQSHQNLFVEWLSNSVLTTVCPVEQPRVGICAASFVNTSSIQQVFKRLMAQFVPMLKKRAFIHCYTDEGMDEYEFTASEEVVCQIISDYERLNDTTCVCNMHMDHRERPKKTKSKKVKGFKCSAPENMGQSCCYKNPIQPLCNCGESLNVGENRISKRRNLKKKVTYRHEEDDSDSDDGHSPCCVGKSKCTYVPAKCRERPCGGRTSYHDSAAAHERCSKPGRKACPARCNRMEEGEGHGRMNHCGDDCYYDEDVSSRSTPDYGGGYNKKPSIGSGCQSCGSKTNQNGTPVNYICDDCLQAAYNCAENRKPKSKSYGASSWRNSQDSEANSDCEEHNKQNNNHHMMRESRIKPPPREIPFDSVDYGFGGTSSSSGSSKGCRKNCRCQEDDYKRNKSSSKPRNEMYNNIIEEMLGCSYDSKPHHGHHYDHHDNYDDKYEHHRSKKNYAYDSPHRSHHRKSKK